MKNEMTTFELQGKEFIELNKLLKVLNLVESGGEANKMIEQKKVSVNGNIESRKRNKLRSGDIIVFDKHTVHIK